MPTPEAKIGRPDVGLGLLSERDEKSLDDKGNPIVTGKPWSEAKTNMFLVIVLHRIPLSANVTFVGRTDLKLGQEFTGSRGAEISFMVSKNGKPTFLHPTIGACLELPDDLGKDILKIKYVTEWIMDTVKESLDIGQIKYPPKDSNGDLGFKEGMLMAAERAIRASGL